MTKERHGNLTIEPQGPRQVIYSRPKAAGVSARVR